MKKKLMSVLISTAENGYIVASEIVTDDVYKKNRWVASTQEGVLARVELILKETTAKPELESGTFTEG